VRQGQELQGWRPGASALCHWRATTWHRPPVPQLSVPGKGVWFPNTSPSPKRYPGTLTKVKDKVQAYLYEYRV